MGLVADGEQAARPAPGLHVNGMRPTELQDHLFALEERFWKEGADYYRRRLAPGAMMLACVSDGQAWRLAFHQQTPL